MRREDWPSRLAEIVEGRLKLPFAWGSHDCVTFAADAVAEITGADPIPELRGRWTTKRGAERVLRKGGGLEAMVDARFSEVEVGRAQRGDLASVQTDDGIALGVCIGADMAVVAPKTGLVRIPMTSAKRAWRV